MSKEQGSEALQMHMQLLSKNNSLSSKVQSSESVQVVETSTDLTPSEESTIQIYDSYKKNILNIKFCKEAGF